MLHQSLAAHISEPIISEAKGLLQHTVWNIADIASNTLDQLAYTKPHHAAGNAVHVSEIGGLCNELHAHAVEQLLIRRLLAGSKNNHRQIL